MTVVDAPNDQVAVDVVTDWLARCDAAMAAADAADVARLFRPDGYWRDLLAFTWDYRTFAGPRAIEQALAETLGDAQPRALRLATDRMPPRVVRRSARTVVEAFFDFDTSLGRGTGFVRLQLDDAGPDGPRVWLLLTTLQDLRGSEETVGERRPTGLDYSYGFGGENWLDRRRRAQAFADRDPEVVVVGAAQAGLALGARLAQMGIDALIVERNPRVGDNWRHRYHSLTLHNEVWANGLPYLPFPPNWPTFVPKDKLAGWLEAYAEFMELNVWTGTEFVGAEFDESTRRWALRLRRDDGSEREVRSPHVVLATGSVSGVPRVPALPGLESFAGEVVHSSAFTSGPTYRGRRAIVVGTGNSGHDVAQDLCTGGAASVTMVQRGPTCVVSLVPSGTMVYALYSEGPAEDIDLLAAAQPLPILTQSYQFLARKTQALDAELLAGLRAAGFELDYGPDDTGFHMKYLTEGGGYYINVGCSDLIVEGTIRVVQARDTAAYVAEGLRLADGSLIPADLVVLATGYENQQEGVRRLLGDVAAERVGPVWGHDRDGFMRGMWRRTGQDGLWIMGGALMECRMWSRFLALQIKAELEGLDIRSPVR